MGKKDFSVQFATLSLREEIEESSVTEDGSVTGGGEAYLPGLDIPEKKYKGPKESEVHDGYDKVKGFRAGHTKDTGGFLYKDLWNVNEAQFKEVVSSVDKDKVYRLLDLIRDKDQKLYNRFLSWISDIYPHGYDEFRMAAGALAENNSMKEARLEIGDKIKVVYGNEFYGMTGNIEDINRGFVVVSIDGEDGEYSMHFSDVEKIEDEELDEIEGEEKLKTGDEAKVIKPGGTTSGKIGNIVDVAGNFYTLQFKNGQKAIFHRSDIETRKKKGPQGPQMHLSLDETIKENYSQFKKETVTRSKAQQMHEAIKLAEKKINEANKILEYTSQLKTELFEDEESTKYTHHTKKVMERITNRIVEAYSRMKKLK